MALRERKDPRPCPTPPTPTSRLRLPRICPGTAQDIYRAAFNRDFADHAGRSAAGRGGAPHRLGRGEALLR